MIHTELRTIRIAIDAIRKEAFTHRSRRRKLAVLRQHIDGLNEKHAAFAEDQHLKYRHDVRETLTDGLRALKDLMHEGAYDETHTMANDRLILLLDVAAYLIHKAEENLPKEPRIEEERPVIKNSTLDDLDAAPPATAFDSLIDEIERGTDEPDDKPDEFEF